MYQGIFRDITDRVRADDALRASEARYRGLIEDQPDLVTCMLPDGTLTFVNRSCAAYYAAQPDDLIGGNVFVTSSVPPYTRVTTEPPKLNYRERRPRAAKQAEFMLDFQI